MSITVRANYDFGQTVYLKTDPDQYPRQIIGVKATADGGMLIQLISETDVSYHYECELSEDKDVMMAMKS